MKYAHKKFTPPFERHSNVNMAGEDWTPKENKLIVADYFNLLKKELEGQKYNKSDHRNALIPNLYGRTQWAVKWKHQNISAILHNVIALPYIKGYTPAPNFQTPLLRAVESYLKKNKKIHSIIKKKLQEVVVSPEKVDFSKVISDAPKFTMPGISENQPTRKMMIRKIDYAKREAENRSLGLRGEEWAIEAEKSRLSKIGKINLASKIKHVSQDEGDGAGFDILSSSEKGTEIFIEVKTTKYGKDLPFYMSVSEKEFLEKNVNRYWLYRVFDFGKSPKLFMLSGKKVLEKCLFQTCQLRVSF